MIGLTGSAQLLIEWGIIYFNYMLVIILSISISISSISIIISVMIISIMILVISSNSSCLQFPKFAQFQLDGDIIFSNPEFLVISRVFLKVPLLPRYTRTSAKRASMLTLLMLKRVVQALSRLNIFGCFVERFAFTLSP